MYAYGEFSTLEGILELYRTRDPYSRAGAKLTERQKKIIEDAKQKDLKLKIIYSKPLIDQS